jgi:leader peptidase (prepilin peptidase)/N-methyltransferase
VEVAWCAALVWSAALIRFDIRYRRLPDALTLSGAVVALVAAIGGGRGAAAGVGAAALAGIYLMVHLAVPAALGAGDVKLAIATGALTGAFGVPVWALAALGAPMLTALLGVLSLLHGGDRTLPHGPSMCVATLSAAALTLL